MLKYRLSSYPSRGDPNRGSEHKRQPFLTVSRAARRALVKCCGFGFRSRCLVVPRGSCVHFFRKGFICSIVIKYRNKSAGLSPAPSFLLAVLATSPMARGQTLTTLYSFTGGTDGAYPYDAGSLLLSGSTIYGSTTAGGANGDGTVFSIPVTGGAPTTLFSFDGTHGADPYGSLILSGSTIYGITTAGGANSDGTVFSIPVTGGTPTTLFSFDGTHGADPYGSLILSGSTLYGTTPGVVPTTWAQSSAFR